MPDKTLTVLVLAAVAFSAAHDLDHLSRDDFSQPGHGRSPPPFFR
jgi:hypothetical protein